MTDTGIDGYRDYLARRDGEADLLNRRLTSREEFFEGLQSSRSTITRDCWLMCSTSSVCRST